MIPDIELFHYFVIPCLNLHSQLRFYRQSNLQMRPPLLSDQFSKIPNVFQSNHHRRSLLQVNTSCRQSLDMLTWIWMIISAAWMSPRLPVTPYGHVCFRWCRLSRIILHRKSGIPISRMYLIPMYWFIYFWYFDIFQGIFLLLCWRNAWCSQITITLKIMPA